MTAFVSDAEIKSIWRRFINREETPEDIENLDPVIYDSWVRSRDLEVDAVEKKEKILSPEELRALQDENRTLVAVTRSYLEKLYSFLEGENFVVFLTDKKGVVLDIMGGTGTSMRKERDEVLLCAGAYRDEGYVGTTSAGLCMHLDRPIQVCGAEHYFEDYHNHTCSSVPIHGLDGSVLGSLGILGLVTAHYRHTLGMAVAAADGIEKELRLRHSYNNIRLAHDQLSSTFQAMTSGLIMLDNAGRVLHHNSQACKILGLFNAELTGTSVLEILQFDGIPGILSLEEAVYSKEVRVKHLRSRKEVSLLLTACPVGSAEERAGIVLTFDPVQRVNKLISQRSGFSARFTFEDITGNSPAMINAKGLASLAAEKNSTVLILGESGTGKELFAHAIHSASERASGPFVAINCAALPHGLIESEMFGYEDGAFTGASRGGRPGKFELADQGTLFLDEIGDMPLHLQASLLRALQFKEVVRVGGNRVIPVDVRIIAATNQNLMEKVREGSFRSDLYFRLNVFPLNLPALRDRKEDIPFLVDAFIRESGSWVDAISESALVALEKYDWPGNVRELQNVIDRATNLAASKCITEKDLPSEIFAENSNAALQTSYFVQEEKAFVSGSPRMTRSAEEDDIRAALQRTGGNVSRASSVLGIPRKTLYRKIEAYHIDLSPFRSGLL